MGEDEPQIDERRFDKKHGAYNVTIDRSDDPDTPDHYHISVHYDAALARRGSESARDESLKLLNQMRFALRGKGITAARPPKDEKMQGIHLLEQEFQAPSATDPMQVYVAYEEAFRRATSMLKVAAEDTEVRDTAIVGALKKALARHDITGADAEEIAREQLRELGKVVKMQEKKGRTRGME